MKAIQIISQDLFDKIRSRFSNLEMGDEQGAVTIDPAEARFFDFDVVFEGEELGRVSISINDPGSLKIYYSQGLTEDRVDTVKREWFDFLKEMRLFAMRRLLRFDTRDITKNNLERKDFQHLATTQGSKEDEMNTMNESRWHRNTKKTSRAVKGGTEVIVRHKHSMDETHPALRSRANKIESIFIQNKLGERFKYPFEHLDGAFAMAQHVEHGGVPHDNLGKKIIEMSSQIAQLQTFERQVKKSTLHHDAMHITETAMKKLQELKIMMKSLGKRHHYEGWAESMASDTSDGLSSELDPVTMEEYKAKFTQSSFNEALTDIFPLLANIMKEANKVNLEDLVKETEVTETSEVEETQQNVFDQFEEWAEEVVEGEQQPLSPEQIADLKKELDRLAAEGQSLPLGPNGETAFETFQAYGLDDSDLEEMLKDAANKDATIDPLTILADWASDNYPELLPPLGLVQAAQGQEPAEVPAEQPPTEPAPTEQPVAEGKDNMIKDIAEVVKRYYNASNESVGPFRSEEAVALEVEKTISEKYGESKGQKAGMIARAYMEKLTKNWEHNHQKSTDELEPKEVEDDGLARIKELLGRAHKALEMANTSGKDEKSDYSITGGPGGGSKLNPMGIAGGKVVKLDAMDPSNPKLPDYDKEEQPKMKLDAMPKAELDLEEMAAMLKLAGLAK